MWSLCFLASRLVGGSMDSGSWELVQSIWFLALDCLEKCGGSAIGWYNSNHYPRYQNEKLKSPQTALLVADDDISRPRGDQTLLALMANSATCTAKPWLYCALLKRLKDASVSTLLKGLSRSAQRLVDARSAACTSRIRRVLSGSEDGTVLGLATGFASPRG